MLPLRENMDFPWGSRSPSAKFHWFRDVLRYGWMLREAINMYVRCVNQQKYKIEWEHEELSIGNNPGAQTPPRGKP